MRGLRIAGACATVVAATFVCFAPSLGNGFVVTWDDGPYIVDNGLIRSLSGEMLRSAFLDFHAYYWAPLTWVSFALDHAVWGLDPAGFHLTNIAIHSLNAGLFFLVSLALLRRPRAAGDFAPESSFRNDRVLFTAMLAALLYSIHPQRVESVAWATERKDVLSLFFGLGSVLSYLKFTSAAAARPGSPSLPWAYARSPHYWMAVGLFILSLLSKPGLVTLPLGLLVLDWYPLERANRASLGSLLVEKAPFALVAGLASAFTMSAHATVAMPLAESNVLSRVFIALRAITEYLRQMAWPVSLSPFHLHPGNVDAWTLAYLSPLALVLAISLLCAANARRRAGFLAAWLFFLIALVPGLGSTQVSLTFMADRFTYVPALGLSLLAAAVIEVVFTRASSSRPAQVFFATGVAALLAASAWLTVRQISFWKDDVSLWSRAIDLRPHFSGRAYSQRASGYVLQGDFQRATADMTEAIRIAGSKKYGRMQDLYLRRARIQRQAGALEEAVSDYTRALDADASPMRSLYLQERAAVFRELGREGSGEADSALADEGGQTGSSHSR